MERHETLLTMLPHGIHWLAGVTKDDKIFYYKLETYGSIPSKSFSVNKLEA